MLKRKPPSMRRSSIPKFRSNLERIFILLKPPETAHSGSPPCESRKSYERQTFPATGRIGRLPNPCPNLKHRVSVCLPQVTYPAPRPPCLCVNANAQTGRSQCRNSGVSPRDREFIRAICIVIDSNLLVIKKGAKATKLKFAPNIILMS
jgi:hypothetical protein